MPAHGARRFPALFGFLLVFVCTDTGRGQDFSKIQVTTTKVADSSYVLLGSGANIGVSIGEDGVLLVDDEFPELVDKIRAAVAALSPRPIRIVLNTNWHYDHADGNERLAESGALIMAHDKSRAHMLAEQRAPEISPGFTIPPYPRGALPVVTFGDSLTIHFNGDEIRAVHIPNAHSDGDVLFQFKKANVIYSGDLFFPNAVPFINFSGGGSIEGMIRAADRILQLADSNTRVVPGHGPPSSADDVRAFRELMTNIRDRLLQAIDAGRTVDEVVADSPLAALYVGRRSYFKVETLTRYGYMDLTRDRQKRQ